MRLSYCIKVFLCLMLLLCGLALAEGVQITLSVDPAELAVPEDVSLSVIIENNTDSDLQNVLFTEQNGQQESIGQIRAGEKQTLVRAHTVTQSELNSGRIRCSVSYDDPADVGSRVERPVTARIKKISEAPSVELTRQISSLYVEAGKTVTLTYRVTNTGNVPLDGIVLNDAPGSFNGRLETLAVGGTHTFVSRVTVDTPMVSAPSLTCKAPSGRNVEATLDEAKIDLAGSDIAIDFSVRKNGDTSADAKLRLTNKGNTAYRDIAVYDHIYGGLIADAIALPVDGKPVEVTFTYPLRGETRCCWRITGVCETGEKIEALTREVTFPAAQTDAHIEMDLDAEPRIAHISHAGYVTFDIRIRNTGRQAAKNVLLYEVNRGEIRHLAVVDTEEPMECSVQYAVSEEEEFFFCLNYTDENDHVRTITAQPITIQVGKGGSAPEEASDNYLNLGGEAVNFQSSSAFSYSLIVLFTAVGILAIALLITSGNTRRPPKRKPAPKRREKKKGS